MLDLKAPLDAVNSAREAYEKQAAAVAAWIAEKTGTDEMTAEALALQTESLDKAEQNFLSMQTAYQKLVKANQPSDVAKFFVPASSTPPEGESPKAMNLSEFNALSPKDRLAFAKRGGKLED